MRRSPTSRRKSPESLGNGFLDYPEFSQTSPKSGIGILYRIMVLDSPPLCVGVCRDSGADCLGLIGAAAAQVVQHIHFHIIPRPALTPELRNRSFTMFGRGQRSEIDDGEAAELSKNLREELAKELERICSKEKL